MSEKGNNFKDEFKSFLSIGDNEALDLEKYAIINANLFILTDVGDKLTREKKDLRVLLPDLERVHSELVEMSLKKSPELNFPIKYQNNLIAMVEKVIEQVKNNPFSNENH